MDLLAPYRVLDLTDVRGQLAGMMLGDLGADVLRIEPATGSDARRVGPLLDDWMWDLVVCIQFVYSQVSFYYGQESLH